MQKSKALAGVILMLFLAPFMVATMPGAGGVAAINLTTTKSNIKENVPITFKATGLTVATYYTLYVDTTLKANKSTSATGTTLDYKIVVSSTDGLTNTFVTIALKDVTGAATIHATVVLEVVTVVPQYTIDMIGGLMPLLMAFAVVFGVMAGIVGAVVAIARFR